MSIIVRIILGTIFLWFYAEFIMLPLYAVGFSKEEEAKIRAEVEEAIKNAPLKSFKISDKGKLKIENWLLQIKILQEQIKTMYLYMDRWCDREKYINGIAEPKMNLYIYDLNTGMFVLKKEKK